MADKQKKEEQKNDPIQQMLDRLRQSVKDLPPEEAEETEEAAGLPAADMHKNKRQKFSGKDSAASDEEESDASEREIQKALKAAASNAMGKEEKSAESISKEKGTNEEAVRAVAEKTVAENFPEPMSPAAVVPPNKEKSTTVVSPNKEKSTTVVPPISDRKGNYADMSDFSGISEEMAAGEKATEEVQYNAPAMEKGSREAASFTSDKGREVDAADVARYFPGEADVGIGMDEEDLYTPEPLENLAETVSVEDFADALRWKGKKQRPDATDSEEAEETRDIEYLKRKSEMRSVPGKKGANGSVRSGSTVMSVNVGTDGSEPIYREEHAIEAQPMQEPEKRKTATERFSALFTDRKKAEADVSELTDGLLDDSTQISEREAELLFRSSPGSAENHGLVKESRGSVEKDASEECPPTPDAENGYAVEVEVMPKIQRNGAGRSVHLPDGESVEEIGEDPVFTTHGPSDMPPPSYAAPVNDATASGNVELIESEAEEDSYDGDFQTLLRKTDMDTEKTGTCGKSDGSASSIRGNRSHTSGSIRPEDYLSNRPLVGEQIPMDFRAPSGKRERRGPFDVPGKEQQKKDTESRVYSEMLSQMTEEEGTMPGAVSEVPSGERPVPDEAAVRGSGGNDGGESEHGISQDGSSLADGQKESASGLSSLESRFSGRRRYKRFRRFVASRHPTVKEEEILTEGIYDAKTIANEYTSRNQISRFARRFGTAISWTAVRIFALAFLATFLLVSENIHLMGKSLGPVFASSDAATAINLLALLLCTVLSLPPIVRAVRGLWDGHVLPELFLTCGFLLFVVYDNLLYLTRDSSPRFFSVVIAVAGLFSAVAEYRHLRADFSAFRLLSSAGDKLACAVSSVRTSEAEAKALSDLPEDARLVSVRKIDFTTGFITRTTRRCENEKAARILLLVALGVSVLTAALTGVLTNRLTDACAALCLSFTAGLPVCLLFIHSYPYASLSRRASANRCAVVGEVSAHEYSDVQAFAFEDVEAFPGRNVHVKRIKLYGDSALDRVLYQVASLFSVVGGPLDSVFRAATAELGLSGETALSHVEDGGIAVAVDGHEISVGCGDYMLKNGIRMYYDPEDERQLAGGRIHIMYAAEDGRLTAKFYILYKMDEDFERSVEQLHHKGIRTLLRTCDPNLSDEMIEKISYVSRFGFRVVHKTAAGLQDFAVPRLNSGLVCRTATADLVRTLLQCRRTTQRIRGLRYFGYCAAALGMLGTAVLIPLGWIPAASVWFSVWQVATVLPVMLASDICMGG